MAREPSEHQPGRRAMKMEISPVEIPNWDRKVVVQRTIRWPAHQQCRDGYSSQVR
ncbi:hypothetical protein [Mesorhizobium sp. INR15]|uniref:hypothetical protein n=1 Tax=Mesorhizobium sp. INR15 TaxID=2654248 RepID=UPI001896852A|nr:hypothetical protein [Mesorhizobium sp. INR15]